MKKRHVLKLLVATALIGTSVAFAGDVAVKGNKSSKVYHKPACKHYTAKGSTESFASDAAAKQAGYKACKQCGKTKSAGKGKTKK